MRDALGAQQVGQAAGVGVVVVVESTVGVLVHVFALHVEPNATETRRQADMSDE